MVDLSHMQTQRMPLVQLLKSFTPPAFWRLAYQSLVVKGIDSASCYAPHYSPWLEEAWQQRYRSVKAHTLVSPERCWYLVSFLRQAIAAGPGSVFEAGTYRGGTALLLRQELETLSAPRQFFIFDSFEGMRETDDERDRHKPGDLADTSLEMVQKVVGRPNFITYRKGWIPESFAGLEGEAIAFAHVDLDLYASIHAACNFIYPRLIAGGVMVFDDYGFPNNPGARRAVNEFFTDKREVPIVLPSGQAVVTKLPD
jgi:O-methyltransferase